MNTKMKMAKVIKITTHANENGHIMEVVSAIDANITPEQFIARLDLIASIKSYEVTKPMPLPYALAYSSMLMRQLGIIK